MSYFTTSRVILFPSFTLEDKETEKLDRFLAFLEDSGVGRIISESSKGTRFGSGRPACNCCRLFAAILYGFAFDKYTLRQIEEAVTFDIRYITLMDYERVDHTTIPRFMNRTLLPNIQEIFSLLCRQIKKKLGMEFDHAFIDGTKFEANANKYKFVWKPVTFHKRLTASAYQLMRDNGIPIQGGKEELISSSVIAKALSDLETGEGKMDEKTRESAAKALTGMLEKVLEYEEKEEICGPNRKSYYKTDRDATAMCLKADYYSGLGSNMHAAYNVQALVIKGFVFSYHVSQARTDYSEFVPVLENFYKNYGVFPKRVCADAGYGILRNYAYLKENGIENYVKYQSWEGNMTGSYPDCFRLNGDGTLTCLGGNVGTETAVENRHPRNAKAVFFRVEGCNSCPYMPFCKKYMKRQDEDFKIFEVVKEQEEYKKNARENLLSPKGIEMRVNRSIQVEGVFGIVKQDYGRDRLNRRGLDKVTMEIALKFLGLNVAKLFRYFETGRLNEFWKAPENLQAEEFRKPSAKRLSKKGKKISKKQQEAFGRQKKKEEKPSSENEKMTGETEKEKELLLT